MSDLWIDPMIIGGAQMVGGTSSCLNLSRLVIMDASMKYHNTLPVTDVVATKLLDPQIIHIKRYRPHIETINAAYFRYTQSQIDMFMYVQKKYDMVFVDDDVYMRLILQLNGSKRLQKLYALPNIAPARKPQLDECEKYGRVCRGITLTSTHIVVDANVPDLPSDEDVIDTVPLFDKFK